MLKPRFEVSTDTEKCCDFLRTRQQATYLEISQHLGRDVRKRDRYVLEAARRKLEREGIVFVVQTCIGVIRASDAQVAQLSTDVPIGKIGRTIKRAKKRERVVNLQNLTAEERAAFYVGRAVLGAMSQADRLAFRNLLRKEADNTDGPVPIERTIELFSKLRPNKNQPN